MNEAGYYKIVNGEWAFAPNGIILPNTTVPTIDPKILQEHGWQFFEFSPINQEENLN